MLFHLSYFKIYIYPWLLCMKHRNTVVKTGNLVEAVFKAYVLAVDKSKLKRCGWAKKQNEFAANFAFGLVFVECRCGQHHSNRSVDQCSRQ